MAFSFLTGVPRLLGAHLSGQCVGDDWDERIDAFVPDTIKGKPEEIKKWAANEMICTAKAAKNMGCYVVTGFLGSPIWKYLYSFPPTTDEMIEAGYQKVLDLSRRVECHRLLQCSGPGWQEAATRQCIDAPSFALHGAGSGMVAIRGLCVLRPSGGA